MANAILIAHAPALQDTQEMHVRTSAQIYAVAGEIVSMASLRLGAHVFVWLAGQEWTVPSKFAAVAMEIALFQTPVSVMKVGWAPSAR